MIPITWRVTHYECVMHAARARRDIVPHVPPESFGFNHVPVEVWYDEPSTSFKVCNDSGEDPTCADSVLGDSVQDHLDYMAIQISNLC